MQFYRIRMRYSIDPERMNWDRIYVKRYGFLSFAKTMGKNLSNKYSQKLIDSAKKFTTDVIKTASKRSIQKTAEATGDLIGNKIADKITSVSTDFHSKKSSAELWSKNDDSNSEIEVPKKDTYLQKKGNKLLGYTTGSDSKFKTIMLSCSLCDYADAYILVKGTRTITGAGDNDAARQADERNKDVVFKNCAPFSKCISKINNTEIDNAQDIDIVISMYNLIEYRDNYSKTSGSFWQYYKDKLNDNLAHSESFKSKVKITRSTPAGGNTKDVKISNFWRTLEMPLINCEVSIFLTWSSSCVITNFIGEGRFAITDTKLYVPPVTLSTQDNAKLFQQLKFGFRWTKNWNKYQSDPKTYAWNRYLNHIVNPSFQGVNRLFYYLLKMKVIEHRIEVS